MSRKDATIKIHAEEIGGEVIFSFESRQKKGSCNLVFQSPNLEDWTMAFIIQDNDLGLKFKSDKRDAFWISKTECPQAPSYDPEFIADKVSPGRKRLIVTNRNKTASEYHFSLNFDSDTHGPLRYDPIIVNKNGQVSTTSKPLLLVAVGAVLVALGLQRLFKRDRDRGR